MGALKYPHKTTDRFHHNLQVAKALKNNLIFSCSFSYYCCEWTARLQQLIHLPLLLQNIVFLVNRKGLNYHDHSFYKESTTSFTWRISLQSRKSCFREIFFIVKRENKNGNKIGCVHDEGIKRIQCTEPHRVWSSLLGSPCCIHPLHVRARPGPEKHQWEVYLITKWIEVYDRYSLFAW